MAKIRREFLNTTSAAAAAKSLAACGAPSRPRTSIPASTADDAGTGDASVTTLAARVRDAHMLAGARGAVPVPRGDARRSTFTSLSDVSR